MFENISASYDVGIAKKYGINCAVLLNKLIYLSKYTSRKDGYCWRTSKELEDELGLSRYQQDVAIKKLTEENIIETKNTYIIGTQIKCKHFKLLLDISKCDLQETNKSIDCRETNICDLQETNKSVNNNNTSINNTSINKKEDINKLISKKEKFKKPTIEEIQAYCKERNNNIDPEMFYDFYESKNWMIGKNKMKDFKACIRTWERSRKDKPKKETQMQMLNRMIREEREKNGKS